MTWLLAISTFGIAIHSFLFMLGTNYILNKNRIYTLSRPTVFFLAWLALFILTIFFLLAVFVPICVLVITSFDGQ